MYAGGTETIETSCLFDIFPEGKNGDAQRRRGLKAPFEAVIKHFQK